MACKKMREKLMKAAVMTVETKKAEPERVVVQANKRSDGLIFGIDSRTKSSTLLQNNLTEFEWAVRNKIYPNFWGRNLNGENALTAEEVDFLHDKGCKIAAIYIDNGPRQTEEQGRAVASKIDAAASKLHIPAGTAIFLEIGENETAARDYMKGFAGLISEAGFVAGFKANTDAAFSFDREFSRGMQTDKAIFEKCLVWAVAPSLKEYDRVTTTHLIHPDNWMPFAPSGIRRDDIAIWQYGKNCHPIDDDAGKETTFNVNLVKNDMMIIERMF